MWVNFIARFRQNQAREIEEQQSALPQVTRFYIPYVDALNAGRNLRGQLTCFLASTGVGKSHIVKYIGTRANVDDGLHVLHFQLEGSEEEALNAYSGSLIAKMLITLSGEKFQRPRCGAMKRWSRH